MAETVKVTDNYLNDFVSKKLQAFIDDWKVAHGLIELEPYGDGTSKLLPGSGKLSDAASLQGNGKTFAAALRKAVNDIRNTVGTTCDKLLAVDSILTDAEHKSDITAQELITTLAPVYNPSSSAPSVPNAPSPPSAPSAQNS